MNLTLDHPRSPKEKMAGLVHVPRMVDKARAAQQNMLGEYIYPCPLDDIMLEFIGVDSKTFQQMACNDTEEVLSAWITEQCKNRSREEHDATNNRILESRPEDPEKWRVFNEARDRLDPARTDVTTWVDLIDLDEGRL